MPKNPNLCERPYCRAPWTWFVGVHNSRYGHSWTLRVCDEHLAPYRKQPSGWLSDHVALTVTARPSVTLE